MESPRLLYCEWSVESEPANRESSARCNRDWRTRRCTHGRCSPTSTQRPTSCPSRRSSPQNQNPIRVQSRSYPQRTASSACPVAGRYAAIVHSPCQSRRSERAKRNSAENATKERKSASLPEQANCGILERHRAFFPAATEVKSSHNIASVENAPSSETAIKAPGCVRQLFCTGK